MFEIIFGIILFIFAVIFFSVSFSMRTAEKRFQKKQIHTDGVVMGYDREDYTKWDTPQVLIKIDGKEAIYRCKSRRMNSKTHPRGSSVRIVYCKKLFLKSEFYDVRIADDGFCPYPVSYVIAILLVLATLFFVAAIILFALGVIALQ